MKIKTILYMKNVFIIGKKIYFINNVIKYKNITKRVLSINLNTYIL